MKKKIIEGVLLVLFCALIVGITFGLIQLMAVVSVKFTAFVILYTSFCYIGEKLLKLFAWLIGKEGAE